MRLGPIFFVLLCLFIYLCSGASPSEVDGGSTATNKVRYTKEEDVFIIQQLARYPHYYIPIHGNNVWKNIAENLLTKYKQGAEGFPQERSFGSIRGHFRNVLIKNNSKVKVPDALMHRINTQDLRKMHGATWIPYNEAEDAFIIEELSKPTHKGVYTKARLDALREEHDKKRLNKAPEFENQRSFDSLRSRITHLSARGQLPDEVLQKFTKGRKVSGASSRGYSSLNQQLGFQETNEGDDPNSIAEMIEELLNDTYETNEGHDPDSIAEMIQELQNNIDFEVDFNNLRSMPD